MGLTYLRLMALSALATPLCRRLCGVFVGLSSHLLAAAEVGCFTLYGQAGDVHHRLLEALRRRGRSRGGALPGPRSAGLEGAGRCGDAADHVMRYLPLHLRRTLNRSHHDAVAPFVAQRLLRRLEELRAVAEQWERRLRIHSEDLLVSTACYWLSMSVVLWWLHNVSGDRRMISPSWWMSLLTAACATSEIRPLWSASYMSARSRIQVALWPYWPRRPPPRPRCPALADGRPHKR